MSNFLAVATVTAALRQMLADAVVHDVSGATVSTERPDTRQNGTSGPRVNIYLYQVTPNAAFRNADLATRGSGRPAGPAPPGCARPALPVQLLRRRGPVGTSAPPR